MAVCEEATEIERRTADDRVHEFMGKSDMLKCLKEIKCVGIKMMANSRMNRKN